MLAQHQLPALALPPTHCKQRAFVPPSKQLPCATHLPGPQHHHQQQQQQQQGTRASAVVVSGVSKKRNPIREVGRDVLPDGAPNTPWRRLKLRIQTAVSLQVLMRLYNGSRHKTAVWRPSHSAGILMRAGALLYYRLLPAQACADEELSAEVLQLLDLLAPDLAEPKVLRVLDGARLCQLLVVLSQLQPQPPPHMVDPLLRELMRNKGNKMPRSSPDLLAELAAAVARLDCREQQLWIALAAAATESLQAQQQQQQQQQHSQRQQQHQQQQQPQLLPATQGQQLQLQLQQQPQPYLLPAVQQQQQQQQQSVNTQQARQEQQVLLFLQHHQALMQQRQQSQQQQQQYGTWLSGDYPKFAAALAAVGYEDSPLLQSLGTQAVPVLPLLSLQELADLAQAYAALAEPHAHLLPALLQQLPQTAQRAAFSSSSSSGGSSRARAASTAAEAVRALHALVALSESLDSPKQQKLAQQKLQETLAIVQDLLMQSGSSSSGSSGSSESTVSPVTVVLLLELLAQAAALQPKKWVSSPLLRWACNTIAAAGLESLTPAQLQAAAAALAALRPAAAAAAPAAAALAAAAVARSEECGPGVMAEVLSACVTLSCYDSFLAEVTVSLVLKAAMDVADFGGAGSTLTTSSGADLPPIWGPLQQQQQQQQQWPHASSTYSLALGRPAGAGADELPAPPVLTAAQQAQLVWALRKMGKQDWAQEVIGACMMSAGQL